MIVRMGKVVALLFLAAVAVLGLRIHAKLGLEERASSYQRALQQRALAVRPGLASTPSEAQIRAAAESLAREFEVELSNLTVSVEENEGPVGAGAMAADALGELKGHDQVDHEGNVTAGAALKLQTTLAKVNAHVHAKGFLCSLDREVAASANFGYALQ
jgi:hypothetical protein